MEGVDVEGFERGGWVKEEWAMGNGQWTKIEIVAGGLCWRREAFVAL